MRFRMMHFVSKFQIFIHIFTVAKPKTNMAFFQDLKLVVYLNIVEISDFYSYFYCGKT